MTAYQLPAPRSPTCLPLVNFVPFLEIMRGPASLLEIMLGDYRGLRMLGFQEPMLTPSLASIATVIE